MIRRVSEEGNVFRSAFDESVNTILHVTDNHGWPTLSRREKGTDSTQFTGSFGWIIGADNSLNE